MFLDQIWTSNPLMWRSYASISIDISVLDPHTPLEKLDELWDEYSFHREVLWMIARDGQGFRCSRLELRMTQFHSDIFTQVLHATLYFSLSLRDPPLSYRGP